MTKVICKDCNGEGARFVHVSGMVEREEWVKCYACSGFGSHDPANAEETTPSYFTEECHECQTPTNKMWRTNRATVRACSRECAMQFAGGSGSEISA